MKITASDVRVELRTKDVAITRFIR